MTAFGALPLYVLRRQPLYSAVTLGELFDPRDHKLCCTVELPWRNNAQGHSCIPDGEYETKKFISPKHGFVWMLQNTAPRTNIEMHAANTTQDLEGCIGVGDKFGTVNNLQGVLNSVKTINMLRGILPDDFMLKITWP